MIFLIQHFWTLPPPPHYMKIIAYLAIETAFCSRTVKQRLIPDIKALKRAISFHINNMRKCLGKLFFLYFFKDLEAAFLGWAYNWPFDLNTVSSKKKIRPEKFDNFEYWGWDCPNGWRLFSGDFLGLNFSTDNFFVKLILRILIYHLKLRVQCASIY